MNNNALAWWAKGLSFTFAFTWALGFAQASSAQTRTLPRETAELAPAIIVDASPAKTTPLWRGVRVYLEAHKPALNAEQVFSFLASGKGFAMKHGDDDFGRQSHPAWATVAIQNTADQPLALVLSTRQTTLEAFELFQLKGGRWVRVLGRHETATASFERDRTPSFELALQGQEQTQLMFRTETAAPIKYLLEVKSENAHRAESYRQHFWLILAYAVPLALMFFIVALRKLEKVEADPLFIALILADLLASSWLIGLGPEIFPRVSGIHFRWFGQISYAALLFILCWHERAFLELDKNIPLASRVLRVTGWLGFTVILGLLIIDLKLGAQMTMPILLLGSIVCLVVCCLAIKKQIRHAKTYCMAVAVYVGSSLAYVLYYLGFAPMELFGVLAFCQTAGICIIMSFAIARSVLAKDQRLQLALAQSDQQRSEIQLLAMERDRIFAAANHDLRQPLQAVALNLELLRQFNLNPEQQVISARMRLALASMSNMLSSFLDLRRASISEGSITLVPVALGPMLDRLSLEYREHARAKGLSLKTVKTSLWVSSDALLLERAIRNLLSNALRYTEQGRVLIGARRRGLKVSIVVIDSGRGISNEQLRQLFREGQEQRSPNRVPAESKEAKDLRYESYGLGLFIVKTICDRLRASVLVSSKLGVGSAFEILLPKETAESDPQTLIETVLPSQASKRHQTKRPLPPSDIADHDPVAAKKTSQGSKPLLGLIALVIDDDNTVLIALTRLLTTWGAEVTQESDAAGAQARLGSAINYDVVICDFDLGRGKTGLELLRIAKLAQPDAKRILMSGRPKNEVLPVHAEDDLLWLSKPVDVALLLKSLQRKLV